MLGISDLASLILSTDLTDLPWHHSSVALAERFSEFLPCSQRAVSTEGSSVSLKEASVKPVHVHLRVTLIWPPVNIRSSCYVQPGGLEVTACTPAAKGSMGWIHRAIIIIKVVPRLPFYIMVSIVPFIKAFRDVCPFKRLFHLRTRPVELLHMEF